MAVAGNNDGGWCLHLLWEKQPIIDRPMPTLIMEFESVLSLMTSTVKKNMHVNRPSQVIFSGPRSLTDPSPPIAQSVLGYLPAFLYARAVVESVVAERLKILRVRFRIRVRWRLDGR